MPLSLSQYIQSTYFSQDEDNASDCDLIQIHVPKKRIRSVSAAGQAIDSLGHVSADLQKHFNAIVILDLSDTGIEDCSLVRQILSHFPNLQEFITSKNPQLKFNRVATASSHDPAALPDITTVISSDCSYNWSDVISFAQNLWPSSIKSLTLHANKITNISMPDETCFLQQLTHLDLSCNPLKDWNEVCNLTQLPRYACCLLYFYTCCILMPFHPSYLLYRLRNLNLSHCAIDSIKFTSNSPQFPHLVTLNVRENNLSSWLDVVQLQKLPSLKELNFKGNPLLSSFEDLTACHLILVRLPKLTKVNNADITRETLKEAEKYYVNTFYTEYESANEEWFRLHPTYKDILERKLQPPARVQVVKLNDTTMLIASFRNRSTSPEGEKGSFLHHYYSGVFSQWHSAAEKNTRSVIAPF